MPPWASTLALALAPVSSALSIATTVSSGSQPWGSWKHTADQIRLELNLADHVEQKNVCCEVGEGFLCAWHDRSYDAFYEDGVWGGEETITEENPDPPFLFGRLAQLVQPWALEWDVEERDGSKVLMITLPKAVSVADGEVSESDAIFDETLHLSGEQCLVPGLSVPTTTPHPSGASPLDGRVFKLG